MKLARIRLLCETSRESLGLRRLAEVAAAVPFPETSGGLKQLFEELWTVDAAGDMHKVAQFYSSFRRKEGPHLERQTDPVYPAMAKPILWKAA